MWNLGSARGPFTVKKMPLFDENASKFHLRELLGLGSGLVTICRILVTSLGN